MPLAMFLFRSYSSVDFGLLPRDSECEVFLARRSKLPLGVLPLEDVERGEGAQFLFSKLPYGDLEGKPGSVFALGLPSKLAYGDTVERELCDVTERWSSKLSKEELSCGWRISGGLVLGGNIE